MDNFNKFINKKYEDIEVPDSVGKDIFELAKKRKQEELYRKRKIKNNILKVAASFTIVLGITSIVYFSLNRSKSVQIDEANNINSKYNLPQTSNKIYLEKRIEFPKYSVLKPDIIAIVKINSILNYTNYSKNLDKYFQDPITIMEVCVDKFLYGTENNNIFNVYKLGGIIKVSELKKSECEDVNLRKYKNLLEKENDYVEIIYDNSISNIEPEIGKTYLVCLKEDNKIFEGYGCYGKYGFVEYNEETGMIKNVETGEWEEIDPEVLDINNL